MENEPEITPEIRLMEMYEKYAPLQRIVSELLTEELNENGRTDFADSFVNFISNGAGGSVTVRGPEKGAIMFRVWPYNYCHKMNVQTFERLCQEYNDCCFELFDIAHVKHGYVGIKKQSIQDKVDTYYQSN